MYKSFKTSGGHVGVPGVLCKKDLWRDAGVCKATLSFGGDASCLVVHCRIQPLNW